MARGIWFQICGAAEEKAQWPYLVFVLGTFRTDWPAEWSRRWNGGKKLNWRDRLVVV